MGLFQSKPQSNVYGPELPPSRTNYGSILAAVLGGVVLVVLGVMFYNYLRKRQGQSTVSLFGDMSSGDKTPEATDGSKKTTISAIELPGGSSGEYSIQYWMYIKDWDTNFGKEKHVVKRVGAGNVSNPLISLHPTDNSLQVRVAVFPTSAAAGASVPTASSTGDSFTCTVENVPLQSWFSVSVTVFQRNVDIYINGRLVKSCVLPGVPKPVSGDLIVGETTNGFSGSVCNTRVYPSMIGPDEAKAFYDEGTTCGQPAGKSGVDQDSTFITLFGYTFRFSTLDKSGKELSSLTL